MFTEVSEKNGHLISIEHGVESAHYTNGHIGYQPVFICVCGFGTSYANGNWKDAGEEFDTHLEGT